MVPVLMSRSSKETSAWRGAPSVWRLLLSCSVLMVLNGLRKIGVAERQQRTLLQIEREEAQPQSAEGDGQNEIQPGGHGARSEFWPSHPEQVDQPHKNQPRGDFRKNFGVALKVLREKQKKRNKKVKHNHDHGHDSPLAVEARSVKADFLGLVAGPDDQQLRKSEVGPKHHKRQKQFSQVVQMTRLQDARKRLGAREQHHHCDYERHGRDELPADKDESIDGGSPVRRKRHHPVDGRETHGKNVKNDAWASQHLQPAT